jgi:hypothetical protein
VLLLVKEFPSEKGSVRRCVVVMQQPVLCRQSSGWSLRTFSSNHRKTSQKYAKLTVWLTRINSLRTIPLMSNKMMSMLLTLFFIFQWEDCCFVSGP